MNKPEIHLNIRKRKRTIFSQNQRQKLQEEHDQQKIQKLEKLPVNKSTNHNTG